MVGDVCLEPFYPLEWSGFGLVFHGGERRPYSPHRKEMPGNNKFVFSQLQYLLKCFANAMVGCNPALEGHRASDLFSFSDIALQVTSKGKAKPCNNLKIRCGSLLQVYHVGLGKHGASTGNTGGGLGL